MVLLFSILNVFLFLIRDSNSSFFIVTSFLGSKRALFFSLLFELYMPT